jgi:hypothetical protein
LTALAQVTDTWVTAGKAMFPTTFFFVLTALLFLGIVGGIAGIILDNRADASAPLWRREAARDVLRPLAGWGSLVALHAGVVLVGEDHLDVGFKHLLGTLALLLFYYAILATLRLIYRAARRVVARLASAGTIKWRTIPLLSRLAYPTLFVSAVLAGATVAWYDGLSQNFWFMAGVVVLLACIHNKRPATP